MKPKLWRYLTAFALMGLLLVSLAAVSLADGADTSSTLPPDPVGALVTYMQGLNADQQVIEGVRLTLTAALSNPEGSGGTEALIQALLREQASLEVILRVTDRLQLMMDGGTNFGQVMKVFRLSLKEGRNAGIERALENAERKIQRESQRPSGDESPQRERHGGGKKK